MVKKNIFGLLIVHSLVLSLAGCGLPNGKVLVKHGNPVTPLLSILPKLTHQITFNIHWPSSFQIQQTAQASHVKLTLKSGAQTIFASNADGNGFVATNGNNNIQLGAQVPDGNNWVATAGFYSNTSESSLIQDVKTAFHVPVAGNVEINMRNYLMGAIVEQLQAINSTKLNSALDINAYQSFVDTLTGMAVNGNSFTFQTAPNTLDARDLALNISNGTIASVNAGSAGGLTASDFKQMPYISGAYQAIGGTQGINQIPAINSSDGSIYFSDYTSTSNTDSVYGLNNNLTQKFKLTNMNRIDSPHLTAGTTNPTNTVQVPAIFALKRNGATVELKAYQQSDGSPVWSFNFGGATASPTELTFTPVTRMDSNGTGCVCDDQDVVYTALDATNAAAKGIYAVRNGGQQWFYNYNASTFTTSGALPPDKSKLYVATYHSTNATLIALDAVNGPDGGGNPLWQLALNHGTRQQSTPVVGTDGTVYLATFDNSGKGYLDAVNPTGTLKWSVQLSNIPSYAPVIDRQNGKDVIYLHTFDAKLHAINEDQTLKWATPVTLPAGPVFSPLIGEEPPIENGQEGSRLIYVGTVTNNGVNKICAIRDKGTQGEIVWKYAPEGSFRSGFNLKGGKLYVTTRDGGDNQVISLQAIKVPTFGFPANAPWPKQGGDVRNSGKKL